MEEKKQSRSYEILRNRLSNGVPFLRQAALDRIDVLANRLDSTGISAEEAELLVQLAEKNGRDVLEEDAKMRLGLVEVTVDDLTLAVANLLGGAV